MASTEQHYSLRWNDYTVKIVTAFQSLRDEEDFVDVTVACDGHHYSAHKMVLSACSPYFRSLLRANPCQHPIVILKDVGHIEMERLLEFMYNGEVNIAQDQLAAFLKTAETLKIRGLAGSSEEMDQIHRDHSHTYSSCYSSANNASGRNSPTVGFATIQEKEDDITESVFASHVNSPASKRRKCASGAVGVSQTETSNSQTETLAESLIESADRTNNTTDNGAIDLEDDSRGDRRELKSEPSEALGDVYTDSSDMASDPNHPEGLDHRSTVYPLVLPGPSGNVQDGVGNQSGASLPSEGAVCEALNLSLRTPPAVHHVNGTTSAFPPSGSLLQELSPLHPARTGPIQQHFPRIHLGSSTSSQLTLIPCTQVKTENDTDYQLDSIATSFDALPQDVHRYSPSMDLVRVSEPQLQDGHHSDSHHAITIATLPDATVSGVNSSNPSEYKSKLYPCPECHKVFRHPMSLHHHRHVHKGTYTCQSCGKVFSRRWDLHRHIHRSKMGCRRPNHAVASINVVQTPSPASQSGGLNSSAVLPSHLDHPYDLNNPPSN